MTTEKFLDPSKHVQQRKLKRIIFNRAKKIKHLNHEDTA